MSEYSRQIDWGDNALSIKDRPVVPRIRRWLVPVVMVTVGLVVIVALGIINVKMSNRLKSVQQTVSNLSDVVQSLSAAVQRTEGKELHHLQLSADQNKDQLISVSEALKQLSVLESVRKTIAALKCSFENLAHNTSAGDGCCPLGWERFGSSCYFFSTSGLPWTDAKDWCIRQEAHLVILNTDKEWDFVSQRSTGGSYWIGLSIGKTGNWEWVNQTPYVMERRHWRPGQPDRWTGHGLGPGSEDCAHLRTNGRLNDLHCSETMPYVCQKRSVHS